MLSFQRGRTPSKFQRFQVARHIASSSTITAGEFREHVWVPFGTDDAVPLIAAQGVINCASTAYKQSLCALED